MYFECRFNKIALLRTVFLAILPTGLAEKSIQIIELFEAMTIYRVISILLI